MIVIKYDQVFRTISVLSYIFENFMTWHMHTLEAQTPGLLWETHFLIVVRCLFYWF